jgi:hypothetical protein
MEVWFCFQSKKCPILFHFHSSLSSNQNDFFVIGGRFMNRNGEPKEWKFQEIQIKK